MDVFKNINDENSELINSINNQKKRMTFRKYSLTSRISQLKRPGWHSK
jgi:hypothetical protein